MFCFTSGLGRFFISMESDNQSELMSCASLTSDQLIFLIDASENSIFQHVH